MADRQPMTVPEQRGFQRGLLAGRAEERAGWRALVAELRAESEADPYNTYMNDAVDRLEAHDDG